MTADHVAFTDDPSDAVEEAAPAPAAVADEPPDEGDVDFLGHVGPWTEAAYLALASAALRGGDGRAELVDGALIVGPGPTEERTHAVDRVRTAITAALPDGLRVVGPVAVRLGPDCVLVPDLVVARALSPTDGPPSDGSSSDGSSSDGSSSDGSPTEVVVDDTAPEVLDAADVLMVVEIIGREHGAVDRLFKPQMYARGRIPYSLLVDRDGPYATASMIISGRYHDYARVSEDGVLVVEEPFPLTIPVRGLTPA